MFTNFHLTETSPRLASVMLRRYIPNNGHSSISARNTHLGSFKMSTYINFMWQNYNISCSGSSQLCPIACHLHLGLCLTLDSGWIFWSKHCDFSAVFGSITQQVRGGMFTADSSLALLVELLPGGMPEHGPFVDGQLHVLRGRALSRGRLWTELLNSSGWCASTVAWSNPIKEGVFFF